jgi:amidase
VLSAAGGRRQDQANADKALRFGQDLFPAAQATRRDLSELEYKSARAMDLQSAKERGLDAVVFSGTAGVSIAAKAGYPWSEAKLLRLAYAYEQASDARRPPTGLPAL